MGATIGIDTMVLIGAVIWILGEPGRWVSPWAEKLLTPDLTSPFESSFHPHSPELTADGNLLLFDNGNHRAIPPDTPQPFDASYSRTVEYRVNEVQGTVKQIWAYGGLYDSHHCLSQHKTGILERRQPGIGK